VTEDPIVSDFIPSGYTLHLAPNIKAYDLLTTSLPEQPCTTPTNLYFEDAAYIVGNPTLYLSAVPLEESDCDVYTFEDISITV